MNISIFHKKFWVLAGVIFALMLFVLAQPTFAHATYNSEQDFIDRSNRGMWILNPAPKRLVDRQDIANNVALFQGLGMNIDENFAWYSNETILTVQAGDTRQFAYRTTTGIGWINLYPLFDAGVELDIFEYAGAFIARPCGNFSPGIQNPPPPKISGYKWNDLNENGIRDAGEPPLANWTIILLKNGQEIARKVTEVNGYYEFVLDARPKPIGLGVNPGTFTLEEIPMSGWRNTGKPGPVEILPGFPGKNYANNDFLNFKPGRISGYKWEDLNQNGYWEKDIEPPLADWEITLKDPNGNLVTTDDFGNPLPNPVFTDTNGYYKFINLPYGTYTVHETIKNGWKQIRPTPPGYYQVSIISGSIRTSRNFGNYKYVVVPPKISGYKWEDVNQDGIWQKDVEPALADWEIVMYKDGVEVPRVVTVTNGYYEFNLSLDFPGTYTLDEILKNGWKSTKKPGSIIIVPTDDGKVFSDNNFGNFEYGKISGHKWNDKNGNGIKDDGEEFLPDWEIVLSKDGTQITTTKTDSNGYYEFTNLDHGNYVVSELLKNNWEQTYPKNPNYHPVLIISGSVRTDKDFGNRLILSKIAGHKWNDLNGNGIWEPGEQPLSDWKIILFKDGVGVGGTQTDANGYYEFTDLVPGTYTLKETLKDGWKNTKKPSPVTIPPNSFGNDFGNFRPGRISGHKWKDLNKDGIWQRDIEPALRNWQITLKDNQGNLVKFDAFGNSLPNPVTTKTAGYYEFANLSAGTYTVSETLKNAWEQTYPKNPDFYTLLVTSGSTHTDKDFGNYLPPFEGKPGWIWGRIFYKKTCSGTIVGIPNVEVKLLPMDDFPGMVTRTDENGYFRFDGLIPNNVPQRPEPAYLVSDGLETKEAVVLEDQGTQVDFKTKRYAAFIDPWGGTKIIIDYIGKNFRFYAPDYGWYPWKYNSGMKTVGGFAYINYADGKVSIIGNANSTRDYAYFSFTDLLRNKWYALYDPAQTFF